MLSFSTAEAQAMQRSTAPGCGESCALLPSFTSVHRLAQRRNSLWSAKESFFVASVLRAASCSVSTKKSLDWPVQLRVRNYQVLSSVAAPDIAGRTSIKDLPQSAGATERIPGFQSLCAQK